MDEMPEPTTLGLCSSCEHAQTISTDRGSKFLLCGLSKSDPRFPRYPRLPVVLCAGYASRSTGPNDPKWKEMDDDRHVAVIFDGECVFCNRWVDFLLRFDRRDVFRFAARQTESGAALLRQAGLPEAGIGSIILVERGAVVQRSAAVLRILGLLGFPFSLATVFRIIPTTPRDYVYEWFARNRVKWFGRLEACRAPSPAERRRFL